jgi:ubiquinone/menaquinone biosynthesis C-methylase UbiE
MTLHSSLPETGATSERTVDPQAAPPARENLFRNYLRLFRTFRRENLPDFCQQHERLYQQAIASGDFRPATQHYYGLMASLIATYYGDGWHFCPPEHPGQSRLESTRGLYRRVARELELGPNTTALDVGCGVGGMLRFLGEYSQARVTGITLGENEVEQGNRLIERQGLAERCRIVQGDAQQMPFADSSFDSAYAVYALKYYSILDRVLGEIHRVLKPKARFVAYCLCKTDAYRTDHPQHVRLLRDFEYSTAMPPLRTVQMTIDAAAKHGLTCVVKEDLSRGKLTWYAHWVRNPLLPWLVSSRLVYGLVRCAEAVGIMPRGFARFNDTFLAGTVRQLIQGGRMGILTGSSLLTFQKD